MPKSGEIDKLLEMDPERVREKIIKFIKNKIKESGAEGIVIGLSGGLDSATTTFLCAETLGNDYVLALFMPEEGVTAPKSYEDAEVVAEKLGIDLKIIEISPIIDKIEEKIDYQENAKVANANLRARARMILLYYYANILNYLVAGGSNKSELRCGYFTKYGDGAADFLPLGSLYKSQVRELSREIGVPKQIIEKAPTADLWEGQSDEKELGLSYEKIDRIYTGIDAGLKEGEIAKAVGVKKSKVRDFKVREEESRHKLERPPRPEL